jgi:hypothetical protein
MEDDGADEDPGQPEGRYANYFKIGHNAFEFLLDFGQFYPETNQAQLHTRIVTTPAYAKALFETLRDSLDQYQQAFGSLARQEWE